MEFKTKSERFDSAKSPFLLIEKRQEFMDAALDNIHRSRVNAWVNPASNGII